MTWKLLILTIVLAYEASSAPSNGRMQRTHVHVDARSRRDVANARLESICYISDADRHDERLFEYVREKKTWEEAQLYCMQSQVLGINGSLICDTTTATNEFLDAKTASDSLWIGGSSLGGEFQWVNGESIPVGPGSKSPRWSAGEPHNSGGNQHCMVANYNGHKWDDQNCEDKKSFVCQYEYGKRISGRIINYHITPATYETARETCQGIDASLVMADTDETYDWLKHQESGLWVGASDGIGGADWVWENGSELSPDFRHWVTGPDHLCAFYSYDLDGLGGLVSKYCEEEHSFACERHFPSC